MNFTQVTLCRYYGKNKASYHKYAKRSFRWCKYCRLTLYRSRSSQYWTKAGGTKPQLWWNYESFKDLPYLTLTCEPWGVFPGSWWRHQMETFSALLAICAGNSPVPGEFPAQRPVMPSFDVFFDLRLNKRLSKQSWGCWFETLPRPLWRHSNVFGENRSRNMERAMVHCVTTSHKAFGLKYKSI